MACHSQFKNIMFRKNKQDAQRSKLFSKLSREITVSAKLGLPDPAHNPRLRAAIVAADAMLEAAIEAGAEESISSSDGHEFLCRVEHFAAVRDGLEAKLGPPESAKIVWQPTNTIAVDDQTAETLTKLLDVLDDHDDIQNVYANYEMSDAVMEKLSA